MCAEKLYWPERRGDFRSTAGATNEIANATRMNGDFIAAVGRGTYGRRKNVIDAIVRSELPRITNCPTGQVVKHFGYSDFGLFAVSKYSLMHTQPIADHLHAYLRKLTLAATLAY
jgi:hypothetical protein